MSLRTTNINLTNVLLICFGIYSLSAPPPFPFHFPSMSWYIYIIHLFPSRHICFDFFNSVCWRHLQSADVRFRNRLGIRRKAIRTIGIWLIASIIWINDVYCESLKCRAGYSKYWSEKKNCRSYLVFFDDVTLSE